MAENRRPSRTTKVALAGTAAAVLLAGGGGTFANWYDDQRIFEGDQTITSGQLTIQKGTDAWQDGTGKKLSATELAGYKMVPGTKLTYTAELDITVEGLTAAVTTDFRGLTAAGGELVDVLQVGATLDDEPLAVADGEAVSIPFTEQGTSEHQLVVTVEFPENAPGGGTWGTTAQGETANLQAFKVALTQAAPQSTPTDPAVDAAAAAH